MSCDKGESQNPRPCELIAASDQDARLHRRGASSVQLH
jgi:hypothetical protein